MKIKKVAVAAVAASVLLTPGVAQAHDTGTPHAHHQAEAELLYGEEKEAYPYSDVPEPSELSGWVIAALGLAALFSFA